MQQFSNKAIFTFLWDVSNGHQENVEVLVGGGNDSTCHLDGPGSSRCVLANSGIAFDKNNDPYFIDGTSPNSGGMPMKIRRLKNGNVETVAGAFSYNAALEKRNQWVILVGDIVANSKKDVIFSDAGYSRIFKVAQGQSKITPVVGSGKIIGQPAAGESALDSSLGSPYWGGDIYALGINRLDELVFRSTKQFFKVDTSDRIQPFGAVFSSGDFHYAHTSRLYLHPQASGVNLGSFNIEFLRDNKMVVSGGFAAAPPEIIGVNPIDNFSITRIAGVHRTPPPGVYTRPSTEFNMRSDDGVVASGSPFQCQADLGKDWQVTNIRGAERCPYSGVRVYERNGVENIYFSELDRIRYIDPSGKYQTLVTGLKPYVANFVIADDSLYYVTSGGKLYCKWLGGADKMPSHCTGGQIPVPAQFPGFYPSAADGLLMTDEGLLISAGKAILRYRP